MNIFKIKNRGETLVEVLVAIGILGVVLITSFLLVNRGVGTNVTVKNKIIAINIAREGIEGIRNIRDTNWLKYSGNRREKWLWSEMDGVAFSSEGVSTHIVFFNPPSKKFLAKEINQSHILDLSNTEESFEEYALYSDFYNNKYTHNPGVLPNLNIKTIFYRQLILTPEKPEECDDFPNTDNYDCSEDSRLHVISRVQWREPLLAGDENASESDLIGTIVMETYLYDYLGRDEY